MPTPRTPERRGARAFARGVTRTARRPRSPRPARNCSSRASSSSANRSSKASRPAGASSWKMPRPSRPDTRPVAKSRIPTVSLSMRCAPSPGPGSWRGSTTGIARRSVSSSTDSSKASHSGVTRSSLLTNTIAGSSKLAARRQTASVCGSIPAPASITRTTASRTRRLRSTSDVKSTWPGVSISWKSNPCHSTDEQDAPIEIPRACSSGIQSIAAVPASTSPRCRCLPVR